MWKEVFLTRTINQKGQPLSLIKRENFLGVAEVKIKEDGTITGHRKAKIRISQDMERYG